MDYVSGQPDSFIAQLSEWVKVFGFCGHADVDDDHFKAILPVQSMQIYLAGM
jgi:hypothetical protein